MPILCLIVFIDLLGFGLLIPLFPYAAEQFGASPFWVTFGGPGVYSLCQLLATPLWGRLSDAYGRKPILVVSMLGATLAYAAMAYAPSLWMLIAARAFQGVMAGNIAAAFAYATDVSLPAERTKSLGMIGAAFGLGFTLGPALGGWLGGNSAAAMNFTLPALVAAALSLIAALAAAVRLPESLARVHRRPLGVPATTRRSGLVELLSARRTLALLVGGALVVQIGATLMQAIYPLWAHHVHGHGPLQVGTAFFGLGVLSVVCQAAFAGPLAKRVGERRLTLAGIALFGAGTLVLGLGPGVSALWVGMALVGIGLGVYSPAISSLVASQAAADERGAVMGTYNAASSAGRIVGPMLAGPVYTLAPAAPFLLGGLLVFAALLLVPSGMQRRAGSRSSA